MSMNQNDFVKLITPFKDKLFRLAKRLLVSTEEAEDATQEVILKLWNNKENLDSYKSIEAYSMTMTKNYCFDQLKAKRSGNLKLVHDNFVGRESGLENQLEAKDSLEWVEKAINELPEQQKLIIQMRDIEEYEFEEIAKIINMNETAIRVALSRARKTIRAFILKTNDHGIK